MEIYSPLHDIAEVENKHSRTHTHTHSWGHASTPSTRTKRREQKLTSLRTMTRHYSPESPVRWSIFFFCRRSRNRSGAECWTRDTQKKRRRKRKKLRSEVATNSRCIVDVVAGTHTCARALHAYWHEYAKQWKSNRLLVMRLSIRTYNLCREMRWFACYYVEYGHNVCLKPLRSHTLAMGIKCEGFVSITTSVCACLYAYGCVCERDGLEFMLRICNILR